MDSKKTAVKDLAEQTSADAQLIFGGIFSLAIIPTCAIVFSAAQIAADELSTKIINSVVINLSVQVTDIFTNVNHSNDNFLSNDAVQFAMVNVTEGYQLLDNVNRAAKVSFDNNPYLDRLGMKMMIPSVTLPSYLYSSRENARNGFMYKKLDACGNGGTWVPEALVGLGFFSYVRCAPPVPGLFIGSPYTCGSAFTTSYALPSIFNKVAPSADSLVLLTDTRGQIIVTNLNGTVLPNIREGKLLTADKFSNPVIQEIGKRVSPKGDSEIPDISLDVAFMKVAAVKKVHQEFTLSTGDK
ncbi:hypothetical protein HK098_000702 [Nowakowskiella sp. JEL0407]|nr:hypothetical protein HK098_000702 [Nowakowskiella sp. JEL0407]